MSDPASNDSPRPTRALAGWGNYPVVEAEERLSEDLPANSEGAVLSRGLGRAYGDASLPPAGAAAHVAGTRLGDRLLAWDAETGIVRCEAGLSLRVLNELFWPRGWSVPVSPGTEFVTLGGMVASDVHGKNHHVAGCFGEHVRSLRLRVAEGRVLEIDDESEPELFRATLGGMGLTGHLLEVELALERIETPWFWRESERIGDFDELMEKLAEASAHWPSTVAWIDCIARGRAMGRGIVMRGRWATAEEAPREPPKRPPQIPVPFRLPSGLANPLTFGLMSWAWYRLHGAATKVGIVSPYAWVYPLDFLMHWNRAFGRRGFTQYQCVLPSDAGVYREFLRRFQRGGGSSFVNVFKDFGPAGRGTLSFPMRGTTLALDMPIRRGGRTRKLVEELNDFVIDHGGRVYLAKDALTRAAQFRAMYPRLEEWQRVRRKWDPEGRLASALSRRLMDE